jgi:hypothetical protein
VKVRIILNPIFGAQLERLDKSAPIWIVQSAANDPVIAELWQARAGDITSFRPQDFGQLIGTVDQHHPGWLELDVYGLSAEDGAAALAEYGDGTTAPSDQGFQFRRKKAGGVI